MYIKNYILIISVLIIISGNTAAQSEERTTAKYISWALIQLFPSPVFYQDADENNSRLQFGLRWQLISLNLSFHSNKYTSPVQFFMINPVRRFTGSLELFLQPEIYTSSFKYSQLNKTGLGAGARFVLPLKGEGEHVSYSIGWKTNMRANSIPYQSIELGIYAVFSMVGIQFNYNFTEHNKYNIGFFIKYF
jgi:hypothetical protein